LADLLQPPVVLADALGERSDLLQDGLERWQKRLRDVLGRPLVEGPCGALMGQAGPEGLDCSLGTWFTSCVRHPISACLERIMAMWAWEPSPLCLTG
jgi:hypothetical protein